MSDIQRGALILQLYKIYRDPYASPSIRARARQLLRWALKKLEQ